MKTQLSGNIEVKLHKEPGQPLKVRLDEMQSDGVELMGPPLNVVFINFNELGKLVEIANNLAKQWTK